MSNWNNWEDENEEDSEDGGGFYEVDASDSEEYPLGGAEGLGLLDMMYQQGDLSSDDDSVIVIRGPGSSQEYDDDVEEEEEELEEEEPEGETDVETSDPDDVSFDPEAAGTPTELGRRRGLRSAGSLTDSESQQSAERREGEDREEEGNRSPPRKVAKMDTDETVQPNKLDISNSNVKEESECLICTEPFVSSGDHRISCLKCGHVFGKNCIEKWLSMPNNKFCPLCNCKATKRDIRTLFIKTLQVMDNSELTEAKKQLEDALKQCSKISLEHAVLKTKYESLSSEVERLRKINANIGKTAITNCNAGLAVPTASTTAVTDKVPPSEPVPSTSRGVVPGRKSCRYVYSKYFDIKEGPCRVGSFNEDLNMLVVSHEIKNSLYPNGCGGIKQINMLEMRPSVFLPIHQKQIRDMAFSLSQNNILLTASLDKKAVLFNCNGNVTVQTFQTEHPLWSCVWDEVNQYMLYLGTSNGQIISFDIRSPVDPVATFPVANGDSSPVCRLKFVRPTYQSNSFSLSGLIVQKLNSVWFCELRGPAPRQEHKFHQLPLEGPFVNVDFEPTSRHMLVSTRPSLRSNISTNSTHMVCDLVQHYSEAYGGNMVTTNLIRTYQGGSREAQKMCRSAIFSPGQGYVYACANGPNNAAKLWDISMSESEYSLIGPTPDVAVDFVRCRVNNKHFLSIISEKGVRVFEEQFS